MRNFVHEMLHDSPAARRIEALWQVQPPSPTPMTVETHVRFSPQEYEDQLTPEARFVKGMTDRSFGCILS
jgi:putative hydrolase of HD superfamily